MTTKRGHSGERFERLGPAAPARCLPWIVIGWLAFISMDVQAGPLVTMESPIGFFTNVASRLLQSQLGISLNHIQIYPTNQYTPSVHRLLQVSANLYDAATNRNFGVTAVTNGYPSVFRPLFLDNRGGGRGGSSGSVFIIGYAEATPADMSALLNSYPLPHDLSDPNDTLIKPNTTSMVYGIPLIIGAKKGYPNFNEFAMQTLVQVTRRLQFHRPGDSTTLPVNEIDQMYLMGISNVFGVEAWNSYSTPFPRPLQMVVLPDISVLVTDLESGGYLVGPSGRYLPLGAPAINIASNAWPGYGSGLPWLDAASFIMPLTNGSLPYTNHVFLTNSTYSRALDQFVPLTGNFERTVGGTNLHVPQWQVTLKVRLRFALVDTGRIVDYVNLAADNSFNITDALTTGGVCGDPYTPSAFPGNMWCTNRMNGSPNDSIPTYGVLNQFEASLGHLLNDPSLWQSAMLDGPPGIDRAAAINFFKGQFQPGYAYSSNSFNAPYQPYRNLYLVTSWQANDPLVHYMLSDLVDPAGTSLVLDQFGTTPPAPTDNLGQLNRRYQPWGGSPGSISSSPTAYDLRVKDPYMLDSDYWDFPTNPLPNLTWLGRVHRGTPWQTLYLKPYSMDLPTWKYWTGNSQLVTNWNGVNGAVSDASFTQPTNDWRLVSLVVSLLSTNDPRNLASVNQPGVPAWCGLLDGMTVLTNNMTDDQIPPPQFASVVMQSNSPQAAIIATALNVMRSSQPGQRFHDIGDILATPELSINSPWLNTSDYYQGIFGLTDEAYEALPSQLLLLLRPDSIGAVSQNGGTVQVQFSGADGYAYVVQTSSNLLDWAAVSTNYPANGSFNFVDTPPPGYPRRFYRSVLWP